MFKLFIRFGTGLALVLSMQTDVALAGPTAAPSILEITLAANVEPVAPAASLDAPGLPKAAPSRGELLYTTHCISCHSKEMHWRDKRVANDWTSLKKQVRRWQDASSLTWSESDITEVARYLNETIYLFDKPAEPVSSLGSQGAAPTSVASRLPPQRSQQSP